MKMKGYVPINLKLDTERHLDKYYYIITLLYYGRIFDKRIKEGDFVPLNAKTLASVLGGRYINYLRYLLYKNIIETNNHYINGEQSKGFKLTDEYKNEKSIEIKIADKNIIRNVMVFKEYLEKGITLPQHKYIFDCLKKIEINEDEARYYIEHHTEKYEEYNYKSISVDLIATKNFFFKVDSTAGRVHNNITNLSRDLRKYLRYKNQRLVEIDIQNSQPFLFNLLIRNYYTQAYSNTVSNILPSYGNPISSNFQESDDVLLYKELTSRGIFYEYLMQYLPSCDRDEFKKNIFAKIFYNDEEKYEYEEWFTFQDIFPNVANIISSYKKDNYKNLAISLQRVEAEMIINKIVPRLAARKIYLLTIHDSILTTPENAEIVKEIMIDEFEKEYGLVPGVKVK